MEAGRLRLRPILMTAFAFIFGVLPLMFATGAGAASRQSLGTAVFGGMVAATLLTLIFVPGLLCPYRARSRGTRGGAKPRCAACRRSSRAPRRSRPNEAQELFHARFQDLSRGSGRSSASAAFVGFRIAGDHADGATESAPAPAMMAMPVPVVPVVKKTLPIYLDYPGRIESIRSIALQARVSGYIDAQPAADGADVKSGDLLYKIDQRDFQAALDQANAQAQRDQASLEYAKANFGRGEELVKSGFVTKDAYDQRASSMHQAEAQLVLDQAAIEAAKLNLGYTEIRAPFAGRLGRNQAAKGALVGPASGALNTLIQLDPIYVAFNPSESDLVEIATARAAAKSTRRSRSRARIRSVRAR